MDGWMDGWMDGIKSLAAQIHDHRDDVWTVEHFSEQTDSFIHYEKKKHEYKR